MSAIIHSHHQHPCTTPFTGILRGYQHEAHQFQETHPKSILADAYGLGKTPTTIATLSQHLPALVICPAYLTNQWFDTLCTFLPTASISMPEGNHQKRQAELSDYADVRIVNIEMLRSYDMPQTNTLIIDEAHHIRGRDTIQGKAARTLIWATPRVHLLTATPFYRADEDIWHLLHCLDPHTFTSYWTFIREWYTVNWHAPYAPHIYGISPKKREAFNQMLASYMLLRDYTDVQRELPPLIEHPITFELPTTIRRAYTRLKNDWQLAGQPIESVGEVYYLLRQLTMRTTKLEVVQGIVDSIPTGTILVYAWYRESAIRLANALNNSDTHTLLITGEMAPDKRANLLTYQRTKKRPRVIVATLEALSEGVDLSHIHHVIYAEETYVSGQHTQALARAHRERTDTTPEANTRPLNVYYVRAKKTIDERIPHIRNSRGHAGNRELARQLTLS